jgi:hypothetical protein
MINKGRKTRLIDGTVLYTKRRTNIIPSEIRKSTRLVITEAAGMIIRGK